jgi:hypothetical protein
VHIGDPLDLSLILENTGPEQIQFHEAFLVLFGRLLDEHDEEVRTPGFRIGRRLPRIQYVIDPGATEHVRVSVSVSPDDERVLPAGRYTVVVPRGDQAYDVMNSLLTSSGASPPEPLILEIGMHTPN